MMGSHKNLRVWQQSMIFVTNIYKVTEHYPDVERFGLVTQMRRAAVSIPSNIAEGYGRSSMADLLHFLHFALGSSNEIDTQLLLSKELGYLSDDEYESLDTMVSDIYKMLSSLIFVKKKDMAQTTVQP